MSDFAKCPNELTRVSLSGHRSAALLGSRAQHIVLSLFLHHSSHCVWYQSQNVPHIRPGPLWPPHESVLEALLRCPAGRGASSTTDRRSVTRPCCPICYRGRSQPTDITLTLVRRGCSLTSRTFLLVLFRVWGVSIRASNTDLFLERPVYLIVFNFYLTR